MNHMRHITQIGLIFCLILVTAWQFAPGTSLAAAGQGYSNNAPLDTIVQGSISQINPDIDPQPVMAPPVADLTLQINDNPDPVIAGTVLTYTVQITNLGPDEAKSVVFTDTLPSEVSFVSSTPGAPTCSEAGGTVLCNLGDMSANSSQTVEILVHVDPSAINIIHNPVAVRSNTADPNPDDNSTQENTQVDTLADLAVQLSDAPDPVALPDTLTYTLWITSYGPSDAQNVSIALHLASGLGFLSSDPPGCTFKNGKVTCARATVPGASTEQIDVMVSVITNTTGLFTSRATINTDLTADPNLLNNEELESTSVDFTAPTVTWTQPVHDEQVYTITGGMLHLEAEGLDDVGVDYIYFYWWDPVNLRYQDIGYDYSAPFTWELDTSILYVNDFNQLFVKAYDHVGHVSPRARILIYRMPADNLLVYTPVIMK